LTNAPALSIDEKRREVGVVKAPSGQSFLCQRCNQWFANIRKHCAVHHVYMDVATESILAGEAPSTAVTDVQEMEAEASQVNRQAASSDSVAAAVLPVNNNLL
jgi:hypothetical protein